MKVLIIGGGGREHTLGWKISQSSEVDKIFFAPGNGGTSDIGENIDIHPDDINELLKFAQTNNIDLTIVGPEIPLSMGIADSFRAKGLKIFGPTRDAAQLESSKAFAKEMMAKYGVPTGRYEIFDDYNAARHYLEKHSLPVVVKASGLAAGKGAIVCMSKEEAFKSIDEIMQQKKFGEAGNVVVIEDFLSGKEASILAFLDGDRILPLIPSQDHKKIYDGDKGPNTGGMGAYAPVIGIGASDIEYIKEKIFKPTAEGMLKQGIPFQGILYAGLMITKEGPEVLEFNVRFGDPETQAILPLMKSDLMKIITEIMDGKFPENIEWAQGYAVCVVAVSQGYPVKYEKGKSISIKEVDNNNIIIFHAGTKKQDAQLRTSGGRVLNSVGIDKTIENAKKNAYQGITAISFEGMYYRKDIPVI